MFMLLSDGEKTIREDRLTCKVTCSSVDLHEVILSWVLISCSEFFFSSVRAATLHPIRLLGLYKLKGGCHV